MFAVPVLWLIGDHLLCYNLTGSVMHFTKSQLSFLQSVKYIYIFKKNTQVCPCRQQPVGAALVHSSSTRSLSAAVLEVQEKYNTKCFGSLQIFTKTKKKSHSLNAYHSCCCIF